MKIFLKTAFFLLLFLLLFSCEKEEPYKPSVTFDFCFEGKTETAEIVEGKRLYPPVLYREGYALYYWLYDGLPVEDWEKFVPEDGMVFEAEWAERGTTIKIRLNPNGGTCDITETTVVFNEEYSFPPAEREGYYFCGWYFDPTQPSCQTFGGADYRDPLEGGTWLVNRKEIDLIARWSVYPLDLPIFMGTFEQDGDLTNGSEPVEWRVLTVEDGKCLLLSLKMLDVIQYYGWDFCFDATYINSDPRKWCSAFYEDCLTAEEKEKVHLTLLEDSKMTACVFLLNKEECYQYLIDGKNHTKQYPTAYAANKELKPELYEYAKHPEDYADYNKAIKRGNEGQWYLWTREVTEWEDSRGRTHYFGGMIVPPCDGHSFDVSAPSEYYGGIRPAMWVDESVVIEAMKNYEGEKTP